VGWKGSKREFKRSFREGAASANGECLVAAFATVAEAQRLVDELHKRLSPNLALTREVTNRVLTSEEAQQAPVHRRVVRFGPWNWDINTLKPLSLSQLIYLSRVAGLDEVIDSPPAQLSKDACLLALTSKLAMSDQKCPDLALRLRQTVSALAPGLFEWVGTDQKAFREILAPTGAACFADRTGSTTPSSAGQDPTRPHKVFLLNADGLDVDKFYDFAFEKTKRCLGDLFKTWPAVGWEGSKREFKRSFREGAASANGECLVAAFATVAEAQRLVDELHKRLSPNLALTRQVTNRVTGTNADSAEAKTPKKEKTPSHPQEHKPELPYQLLPLGVLSSLGPRPLCCTLVVDKYVAVPCLWHGADSWSIFQVHNV
jgi:hypothetical protein